MSIYGPAGLGGHVFKPLLSYKITARPASLISPYLQKKNCRAPKFEPISSVTMSRSAESNRFGNRGTHAHSYAKLSNAAENDISCVHHTYRRPHDVS